MCGEADADKIVRFEKCGAVLCGESLTRESFVEYGLNAVFHYNCFSCLCVFRDFAEIKERFPQRRRDTEEEIRKVISAIAAGFVWRSFAI
jgi:hypothetical protein